MRRASCYLDHPCWPCLLLLQAVARLVTEAEEDCMGHSLVFLAVDH